MAEASVNVTEGSGKRLHAWDRTISAQTVLDEFTLPGEYPYASYTLSASNVSVATSADHVMQIMAGSSLNVRVRRIYVVQRTAVTTAATLQLELLRLTTAGTGGTTVTARPMDSADAAAGCTGMTLPSSKGTEGVSFGFRVCNLVQTIAAGGSTLAEIKWEPVPNMKSWIIPAGTSNGFALKVETGRAGATVNVIVEVVETAFV